MRCTKTLRKSVKHGSCETPYIKWLSNNAGQIRSYRAPSIGEQCLLLNLTGGDDPGACFALFGIDTQDYPLPSISPSEHKIIYPNGTVIIHNHEENTLVVDMPEGSEATVTIPTKIAINTQLALLSENVEIAKDLHVRGEIKGDEDITDKHNSMDSMRDVYHSHDHSGAVGPPVKRMK